EAHPRAQAEEGNATPQAREQEEVMGLPVVTVASGGLPIVESTVGGTPVTEAANGRGVPVTKVVGKPGLPVVFETIGIGGAVDISKVVFIAGWEGANGATVYSEER